MKRFSLFLICLILFCTLEVVQAGSEVVLTIKGAENQLQKSFTEGDIRALPAKTFTTFDPWEKKQRTYTGCTINNLLDSLGLTQPVKRIHVIARDKYNAKISETELKEYTYILSYEMDGKDYSQWGNSDKGPLAIMIKMEDVSDEDKVRVKNQMVLWVKEIILH